MKEFHKATCDVITTSTDEQTVVCDELVLQAVKRLE
jgi:hypothetical protein